ncbi:MAG: hypothetical protein H7257_10295 [Taibaiella sp.]|nr:hypothetical protein [Taibaiella sp.]
MNKHTRQTNGSSRSHFSALTIALTFFVFALSVASCKKNDCNTDPDAELWNTVNISDIDTNPATYHNASYSTSRKPQYPVSFTSTGPVGFIGVDVIVSREGTSYFMQIATGSESPVSINLITGPGAGTGTYQVLPADADRNIYLQNVPTGEAWKCTGGSVNVTSLKAHKVTGTFTLDLSRLRVTKTVTGTFDANDPLVTL